MDIQTIQDINILSKEQVFSLKAQLVEGRKHLQYVQDTEKHFKYPEKRLKTFDTKHYERIVPEIEQLLTRLGKL